MSYSRSIIIGCSGNGLEADQRFRDLLERLFRLDHEDMKVSWPVRDTVVCEFAMPKAVAVEIDAYAEMQRRRLLTAIAEWRIDAVVTAEVNSKRLHCDGERGCVQPVSHIDEKGYAYCAAHGEGRKAHCRCRKLRPAELKRLEKGEPLTKY